jgi:hypothetical protein
MYACIFRMELLEQTWYEISSNKWSDMPIDSSIKKRQMNIYSRHPPHFTWATLFFVIWISVRALSSALKTRQSGDSWLQAFCSFQIFTSIVLQFVVIYAREDCRSTQIIRMEIKSSLSTFHGRNYFNREKRSGCLRTENRLMEFLWYFWKSS